MRVDLTLRTSFPFHHDLATKLLTLWNMMMGEMAQLHFVFIPPNRAEYFDYPFLFEAEVYEAFPSARLEIYNAGNCISMEMNDAAIFYLMRACEFALRALAKYVKVKMGKGASVDSAMWSAVINKISEKVKPLAHSPYNKRKTQTLQFYQEIILEARALKDLWRNPVMHSQGMYSHNEAVQVFNHSKGFMQRISKRVKESGTE